MSDQLTVFQKMALCVDYTEEGGTIEISCKLGLWSVCGDNSEFVYNDALHYWKQYADDGEYSHIIGGRNVIDTLIEQPKPTSL